MKLAMNQKLGWKTLLVAFSLAACLGGLGCDQFILDHCIPDCTDKACGDDGCGGSCGSCGVDETCGGGGTPFVCGSLCEPDCLNKECGDNGCGGSCGSCVVPETCGGGGTPFACGRVCEPDCLNKECGDDSCGGSCGSCLEPETCGGGGTPFVCGSGCEPDCLNKECGDDGCGGSCGPCAAPKTCGGDGLPFVCGIACEPDCLNKECGADGCGGSCGSCDAPETCGGGGVAHVCGQEESTQLDQPMCVWNHAYIEHGSNDSISKILSGAQGCYVLLDPFEANASTIAQKIDQIKQNHNLVGCYMSSGTCEPWRDDMNPLPDFCGEYWPEWDEYYIDVDQEALLLMKARINKMAAWGCEMIEFDNMDWKDNQEAIDYNNALCTHARSQGVGCMAKSTTGGSEDFDGFTVESYPDDRDWWSASDMHDMLAKGGIGLIVHYDENGQTACQNVYNDYLSKYGPKLSFICSDRAKYFHYNR